MIIVADTEADNLVPKATVIHCLCLHVIDTKEDFSFADQPGYAPIRDGLKILQEAEFIVGHNFRSYDAKLIKKLTGVELPQEKILDTLEMCRKFVDVTEMEKLDYELHAAGLMPLDCVKRMSLKAWGHRLGRLKGTFGETTDWQTFSTAMVEYCVDDVLLNRDLYLMFEQMFT